MKSNLKLNLNGINVRDAWSGYRLPAFDIALMREKTRQNPIWLHMGAGNIFRAFPAVMQQDLLEAGLTDRGIVVCECFDDEIIPKCYTPYDNLSLLVTLKADGSTEKRVIASVAEAFNCILPEAIRQQGPSIGLKQAERLHDLFSNPSLQWVTFTITEKGYAPSVSNAALSLVTSGLLSRFQKGAYPLALVSLDNCSENGDKLAQAVRFIAGEWYKRGLVKKDFLDYLNGGSVSFPWSMIDKITPRPSEAVAQMLREDGYEDAQISETNKHTFIASFVNAEACQYLVIEDDFPNGRPNLDQANPVQGGVYLTDRTTVRKTERMKVGACLNPLHTILAVTGCLLGYGSIAETVRDKRLAAFIRQAAYDESLPVAVHPGVIDPARFLEEVLTERLPNPFIPDTPARIACDTSQKIPVRFGETIKERIKNGLPVSTLEAIPLFFALWLRYLLSVGDNGAPIPLSPDPRLTELTAGLAGVKLGGGGLYHDVLQPILSDASIFGVDLYDKGVNLGEKVERLFSSLTEGPNAVSRMLEERFGSL